MRDDWSLPVSACSKDMITLLLLFLFVFLQAILYIKILALHLQHHLLPSSVNADAFKGIQLVGLWVIKYPKTFSRNHLTEGSSKPDRAQKVPWGTGKAALTASTEHSLVRVLLLTPWNWPMMFKTIRCSLQNFMACMDRWNWDFNKLQNKWKYFWGWCF